MTIRDTQANHIAKTLLQLRKWAKEIDREVKFAENQCEQLYAESNESTAFAPNFADFMDEMFPNAGRFRSNLVTLISLENDLVSLCDSASIAVSGLLKKNFNPFIFRNTGSALRQASEELAELQEEREVADLHDDERQRIINRVNLIHYIADKCHHLVHHLYWMLSSMTPQLRQSSLKHKRATELERLCLIDNALQQKVTQINNVIQRFSRFDEVEAISLRLPDCSLRSSPSSSDDIPTSPVFCA